MVISMIAAKGRNNEIGVENRLLWHIPADLKFFKSLTMGKSLIMGRKTFESLPKALPGRKNIVMTTDKNYKVKGAVPVRNAEEALKAVDTDEVFIIGGESVYRQFLYKAQRLYITEVDFESDGADAFFPEFDLTKWKKTLIDSGRDNFLDYKHILYERI